MGARLPSEDEVHGIRLSGRYTFRVLLVVFFILFYLSLTFFPFLLLQAVRVAGFFFSSFVTDPTVAFEEK